MAGVLPQHPGVQHPPLVPVDVRPRTAHSCGLHEVERPCHLAGGDRRVCRLHRALPRRVGYLQHHGPGPKHPQAGLRALPLLLRGRPPQRRCFRRTRAQAGQRLHLRSDGPTGACVHGLLHRRFPPGPLRQAAPEVLHGARVQRRPSLRAHHPQGLCPLFERQLGPGARTRRHLSRRPGCAPPGGGQGNRSTSAAAVGHELALPVDGLAVLLCNGLLGEGQVQH
mmetsp:Transcript_48039/g.143443  ORF Transcript_48039/g.143443 Transcript_48039/m.143443 type:complete len:224 (-) Transcript_48039:441-1112(-)